MGSCENMLSEQVSQKRLHITRFNMKCSIGKSLMTENSLVAGQAWRIEGFGGYQLRDVGFLLWVMEMF